MDNIYREIYSALYWADAVPPERLSLTAEKDRELRDLVRRVIDDKAEVLQSQFAVDLRPDAKLLLLTNLHELVTRPVTLRGRLDKDQLKQALESDVQLLINNASQFKKPSIISPGELSAHSILQSLNMVWQQLKLTQLNIWE